MAMGHCRITTASSMQAASQPATTFGNGRLQDHSDKLDASSKPACDLTGQWTNAGSQRLAR
eukprot:3360361-Alexandrium_andersonii.AAC.1